VALLGLLFVAPLLGIVFAAFAYGSPAAQAAAMLQGPYYRDRLVFTVEEAVLSTFLTVALGLPVAWAVSRELPGASAVRTVVTLPFVLPPLVVAIGLAAVVPSSIGTFGLILLAHAFYNVGIVTRSVAAAWANQDARILNAASTLGASPWKRFLRVELPLLAPALLASGALVFLFTFTSLGVILVLAGPHYYTIEAAIWSELSGFDPARSFPRSAILAGVQLFFTLAAMFVYAWAQRETAAPVRARRPTSGPSRPVAALAYAIEVLAVTAIVSPLIVIAYASLRGPAGLSFAGWQTAASYVPAGSIPLSEALFHTVAFSLATLVVAVPLGVGVALLLATKAPSPAWDTAIMAPLGMSAVTLGFGLLVVFPVCWTGGPACVAPGGPMLIVLAHALLAFPFVARLVLVDVRALRPRLVDAAATLGASPTDTVRRVVLPLLEPAVRAAAIFAFAISAGEFGAALILARPDTITLPVAMYAFLAQPGATRYGAAMAIAVLLILLNGAVFFLMDRAGRASGRTLRRSVKEARFV
jgi:thiamine transport system permease protein